MSEESKRSSNPLIYQPLSNPTECLVGRDTPELPIKYAVAVQASMSLPFVSEPMSMAEKGMGCTEVSMYIVRCSAAALFVEQYLKHRLFMCILP